jgi:hypothetical protein
MCMRLKLKDCYVSVSVLSTVLLELFPLSQTHIIPTKLFGNYLFVSSGVYSPEDSNRFFSSEKFCCMFVIMENVLINIVDKSYVEPLLNIYMIQFRLSGFETKGDGLGFFDCLGNHAGV